jgi:CARDB protein
MLPFLLALAVATAAPAPCPSDLLVANPRLKVVRANDKARDNYVVTVDVKNRGVAAQPTGTMQHLELVRDGTVIGTQPLPAIGANESYPAAFRVQLPHQAKRAPFAVEFRYVLDSKNALRANCTSVNDRLTATR